jgi:hypothetical protein
MEPDGAGLEPGFGGADGWELGEETEVAQSGEGAGARGAFQEGSTFHGNKSGMAEFLDEIHPERGDFFTAAGVDGSGDPFIRRCRVTRRPDAQDFRGVPADVVGRPRGTRCLECIQNRQRQRGGAGGVGMKLIILDQSPGLSGRPCVMKHMQ